MEPDANHGQFTGYHHRPPAAAHHLFNQRTVAAVVIPCIGYSILEVFTPQQMGVAMWAGVALGLLPALCGLIVHSIGEAVSTRRRMSRAALIAFLCFFGYGLLNMSIIHSRIQTSGGGLGPMPAMLMVAFGYGVIAAAVSALVASLPVHHVESHR